MTVTAISHAGPSDGDPLTPGELEILLAIPRAAKSSPGSLLFRLPNGDHPSMGYVDLTCLQTFSLVSRLAASWRTRLSTLLGYNVGPGTTVCIMARPYVHGIFHHLAIWALGCTIQFVSQLSGAEALDDQLRQSGCEVVVHCGNDEAWAKERKERLGIEVVELTETEYSHAVAQKEVSSSEPAPEWPALRRPSPAIVVHSSATTGKPKLISFSLHFYTFGLAWNCEDHLATKITKSKKDPHTHPRLIYTPPFWASFHRNLLCHLITATPVSLIPSPDRPCLSGEELITWMKALGIGSLVSASFNVRGVILLKEHTEFLQSLHSITMIGSVVDEELSDMISRKKLNASNVLGITELGRLLIANRPPYAHLRPYPDFPPPISLPVSDEQPEDDKSQQSGPPGREVELWYTVESFPPLEHVASRGGVPLKLKPFPGPGPAHGKLAVSLEDVFYETYVPGDPDTGHDQEVAYMHLGRTDDYLRSSSDDQDINACQYEIQARSLIESELEGSQWQLDVLQLFGTNLPKTALVVQLQGRVEPDEPTMQKLRRAVEMANDKLGYAESARVDPSKRMLVVTRSSDKTDLPSPMMNTTNPSFAHLRLSYTHKHTLQRYRNVKTFGTWLEQLNWN